MANVRLRDRLFRVMLARVGMPRMRRAVELDLSTSRLPGAITSLESSPSRFDIPLGMAEMASSRTDLTISIAFGLHRLMSLLRNKRIAVESIATNPESPVTEMSEELKQRTLGLLRSFGVTIVGHTRLPRRPIFRGMGVLCTNAIVLAMEMDRGRIEMAPSAETARMILETYDRLGIAANRLAEFLRSNGLAGQASHPLGGLVLYPPFAQLAGLGWVGRHGLLITPELGPRVRLATVFTSAEDLRFADDGRHRWIQEYCERCGRCIRDCPVEAILEEPVVSGDRVTHIDRNRCFPYFLENYGCTICVKVCPSAAGRTLRSSPVLWVDWLSSEWSLSIAASIV